MLRLSERDSIRRFLHAPSRGKLTIVNRLARMIDSEVYDEPSEIDAEDGAVVVKGPDAVDVRLTPAAAEETSERLLQGAMKARGQRYFDDRA